MDATSASGSPRGPSDEFDHHSGSDSEPSQDESKGSPPKGLPEDLPKSLDDRRSMPVFQQETEMYDAWQGGSPSLSVQQAPPSH
jgi:hypothetical protein